LTLVKKFTLFAARASPCRAFAKKENFFRLTDFSKPFSLLGINYLLFLIPFFSCLSWQTFTLAVKPVRRLGGWIILIIICF
jgi:hypothetical protein